MKYLLTWIISIIILHVSVSQSTAPIFKKSKKTTHKIKKNQEYTFGYLHVPENRSNPNSSIIKIPVYIFKSRNKQPKDDPIIYTVGGPGSTSMPSAQYMNYYKYLDDRDFIVIEQRGNFYAEPHLDCAEWANAEYIASQSSFHQVDSDSLFERAALECSKRLRNKGIDLDGYRTREIANDINDLVDVLHIEKYNLLTISYSTKIAQVLLRDHPERIRSIVMDSVLPLEVNYDEESLTNLMEAMDLILENCENSEACNQKYPDIKKKFHQYLIDKTITPLEVKVSYNQRQQTILLSGSDLINIYFLIEPENIPYEIDKLFKNDLTSIEKQLYSLFENQYKGAGIGMRLSVWCAEEYPFNNDERIQNEMNKYPEISGASPMVFSSEICEIWGVSPETNVENMFVESEIPILFINGEFDNETPPKWAKDMKSHFVNSFHLVFEGWKHTPTTNWANTCAMEAANDFFNNPHQRPKTDCLKSIKRTSFKIN